MSASKQLVQAVSCLQGRKVAECDILAEDIQETLSDLPSLLGDCHFPLFCCSFPIQLNILDHTISVILTSPRKKCVPQNVVPFFGYTK